MNKKQQSTINILQKQLEQAQERLHKLELASREHFTISQELQQEALTELSISLEELQVVIEELMMQNQELLATHQSLVWEQQKYQNLFEFAPSGYIVTDFNLTIQEVNKIGSEMLNISVNYLKNKPLTLYIAQKDHSTFLKKWTQIRNHFVQQCQAIYIKDREDTEDTKIDPLSLGYPRKLLINNWELFLQPRNSNPFPANFFVAGICDDQQELMRFYWLIQDLTSIKEAEEAHRKLEKEKELRKIQNRLFSLASHELRTPIAVILTSVQNLLNFFGKWTEEKQKQKLKKIEITAKNMGSLIDEIMEVSRVEVEKLEIEYTGFDLEDFCQKVIHNLDSHLKNNQQIKLITKGLLPEVYLDKKLLKYIISNLLCNAIKYSWEESIIKVTLKQENSEIILEIRDQGIGIPEKDKNKIFEEFYRGENVGKIHGSGLGLSLVKKCVELHKGTISFVSEEGKGTTFTVKLKSG